MAKGKRSAWAHLNISDSLSACMDTQVALHKPKKKKKSTIAGFQIILNICIEVATQPTGTTNKFWIHLNIDGATTALPCQHENLMLWYQDVVRDPLQLNIMNIMWEL